MMPVKALLDFRRGQRQLRRAPWRFSPAVVRLDTRAPRSPRPRYCYRSRRLAEMNGAV